MLLSCVSHRVRSLGGATFVVERGTNKVFNPTGWKYHSAKVQALGVNPSGTAVATASLDSNVILWNDHVEWSSDKRVKIEGGCSALLLPAWAGS